MHPEQNFPTGAAEWPRDGLCDPRSVTIAPNPNHAVAGRSAALRGNAELQPQPGAPDVEAYLGEMMRAEARSKEFRAAQRGNRCTNATIRRAYDRKGLHPAIEAVKAAGAEWLTVLQVLAIVRKAGHPDMTDKNVAAALCRAVKKGRVERSPGKPARYREVRHDQG